MACASNELLQGTLPANLYGHRLLHAAASTSLGAILRQELEVRAMRFPCVRHYFRLFVLEGVPGRQDRVLGFDVGVRRRQTFVGRFGSTKGKTRRDPDDLQHGGRDIRMDFRQSGWSCCTTGRLRGILGWVQHRVSDLVACRCKWSEESHGSAKSARLPVVPRQR